MESGPGKLSSAGDWAIETLTLDDLGALAHLAARCFDHDELPASLLRRRLFADPDHRDRYSLAVRQDGRLVGAAVGLTRARAVGPWGCVRLLAVEPSLRRRGIATTLLAELEARLAADGARQIDVGTETPIWLFAGVDVRYTAALCLFERRGYVRLRDTSNLAVDLVSGDFDTAALEARLAERDVVCRRIAAADRPALDAYLTARWSPAWRYECLRALDAEPPTGFIALREGRIVGFAVYDIARPGWFGPIGTDQEQRGLGIGTVLHHRCMLDWQRAGRKVAEIAWIGPLHFYSSIADARVCRVFWQMRKELPAGG